MNISSPALLDDFENLRLSAPGTEIPISKSNVPKLTMIYTRKQYVCLFVYG